MKHRRQGTTHHDMFEVDWTERMKMRRLSERTVCHTVADGSGCKWNNRTDQQDEVLSLSFHSSIILLVWVQLITKDMFACFSSLLFSSITSYLHFIRVHESKHGVEGAEVPSAWPTVQRVPFGFVSWSEVVEFCLDNVAHFGVAQEVRACCCAYLHTCGVSVLSECICMVRTRCRVMQSVRMNSEQNTCDW